MTFPHGIIKTDYINTTDSTVNKVEEEKNCGCGQDPCETYGVKSKTSKRGRSRPRRAKKSNATPPTSTSDCEWRKAPDGEWYTKSMFYDHYEGYDEWEQAQYISSLEKELKRGDYEKAQYIESLEKKLKTMEEAATEKDTHISSLEKKLRKMVRMSKARANETENESTWRTLCDKKLAKYSRDMTDLERKLEGRDKRIEELLLEKQDLIQDSLNQENEIMKLQDYVNMTSNISVEQGEYLLEEHSVNDNDCQYGEVTWAWKGLKSISEAKQLAYEEYKNPWTWFEIHSMDENGYCSKLETGMFVGDDLYWRPTF